MFCPKCGSQVADGAAFCPKCGARVPSGPKAPSGATAAGGAPAVAPRPARGRGALVGAAVGVVALLAVVAVVVLGLFGKGPAAGVVPSVVAPRLGNELANLSMGGGYVASADGYDYFVSYRGGGVCRAKAGEGDAEAEVVYPLQVDMDGYSMASSLNVMDGWVYLVDNSYHYSDGYDQGHTIKVVRVRADGSEQEDLYEVEPENENGDPAYVQSMYVYDDTVYLVVQYYDSSVSKYEHDIVTFGTDGSDAEVACSFDAEGAAGVLVTPDRLYYYSNPSTSSTSVQSMGKLCAMDLDGSDFEELYQSSFGSVYGLSLEDGRLVFSESNYGAGRMRVVSLATDGSDERTVYESGHDTSTSVGTYADGKAYLVVYDNGDGYSGSPDRIEVAPLSGEGDVEEIGLHDEDIFSLSLSDAGDHLVVLQGGGDFSSLGHQVDAVGYDGSELATYVD